MKVDEKAEEHNKQRQEAYYFWTNSWLMLANIQKTPEWKYHPIKKIECFQDLIYFIPSQCNYEHLAEPIFEIIINKNQPHQNCLHIYQQLKRSPGNIRSSKLLNDRKV